MLLSPRAAFPKLLVTNENVLRLAVFSDVFRWSDLFNFYMLTLTGVGRMSYTAIIRKLILFGSSCLMSPKVSWLPCDVFPPVPCILFRLYSSCSEMQYYVIFLLLLVDSFSYQHCRWQPTQKNLPALLHFISIQLCGRLCLFHK